MKTKKYACYHYHTYHHSRECGEETGIQTEEEQKTKGHHHYMIIIIIIKTKIKQETSQGYHITTTNTERCPCKMWQKRIWSCTAGLLSECADREISARVGRQ